MDDLDHSLQDIALAPLLDLIPACSKTRACPDFSDGQFLATGLLRTLSHQESGRDFLQSLIEAHQVENVECSQFFETLKSKRCLGVVTKQLD